jgi:hypothetical protein
LDKIPILIVLSVLVSLTASSTFASAFAFGPTCQYSSVIYNYPSDVNPSQQFLVSISMPTLCPQANNYHVMARLDIENGTNWVLASNYTQYGFVPNNGKPFTFLVTDRLTAPSKGGAWQLRFVVYVFMSEDDADGLDYKVAAHETIQVEQPNTTQSNGATALSTVTQGSTPPTLAPPATTQIVSGTTEPPPKRISCWELSLFLMPSSS